MSLEPLTLEACGTEFVNRLDGNGWTRQGIPVSFEMAYLLNEVTADRAEMSRLKLELASRYDAEIVGMAEAASSGALEADRVTSSHAPREGEHQFVATDPDGRQRFVALIRGNANAMLFANAREKVLLLTEIASTRHATILALKKTIADLERQLAWKGGK